jgi:hypothetical protein
MKLLRIESIFLLATFVFFVAGCSNTSKSKKGTTTEGKEASVEVEIFDAVKVKDQIVEIIQKSPGAVEVAQLLSDAGASYILDLTLPVTDAEKLLTTTQMSIGLGMYAFDFQYANIYRRGDVVSQTGGISKQLITKLGLEGERTSSENFVGRIKANADNKDSVDFLVAQAMNFSSQQLASGNHPDIYALTAIGANVEALYVLSQLTLLATDNSLLLKIMGEQKARSKTVFSLLELMSGDENVKPYYEKMVPVFNYFEGITSFGEKELKEITPLIEKLRNSIL